MRRGAERAAGRRQDATGAGDRRAHAASTAATWSVPTFVLVHEYRGARPIYHLDAYRLRDDDEFLQLGADEYFRAAEPGVRRMGRTRRRAACRPSVEIAIAPWSGNARRFEITARGERSRRHIEAGAIAGTSR